MEAKQELLIRIKEGMLVFDARGDEVGKVDEVYLGGGGASSIEDKARPAVSTPSGYSSPLGETPDTTPGSGAFGEGLPETVRGRLLESGFVRISGGFIKKYYYVLPEELKAVSGEQVRLQVLKDNLTQG